MRPQSYESVEESAVLVSLFPGRSGNLENTVFALLGPGGKEVLTRAGRSPRQQFRDAAHSATHLDETFSVFERSAKTIERLPLHDELALALNVAACDQMPLVILHAQEPKALEALKQRVAGLAWSAEHRGLQHYCAVGTVRKDGAERPAGAAVRNGEVAPPEIELKEGVTVVAPGPYGIAAKTLGHVKLTADGAALSELLSLARSDHNPKTKDRREHIRSARRAGIVWKSELPKPERRRRR